MAKAINDFLIAKREDVKNITEEEFKIHKKAVETHLKVKDMHFAQEAARHIVEITCHKYLFDR